MPEPGQPLISIVLIAGDQRARAALALRSLLNQAGIERAEILLFDYGSQPDMPPLPGADHPCVRTIRQVERIAYGRTCAQGVELARGRYVAYLEEHCQARPGYLAAIESALAGDWSAVGPEVGTYWSGPRFSNVIWLMNYPASLRAPARRRETDLLVGHNMAYRRDVLLAYGDRLHEWLENDDVLNKDLARRGLRLGIEPAMKICHGNERSLAIISRGYYLWHRSFAHHRFQHGSWPGWYKAARLLSTPLMPLVRWGRYLLSALRERSDDLPLVLLFAPHILIAQSAAAAGTLLGYLWGEGGETGIAFASYEIDSERDVPDNA